ncbi:MAG TPA: sulfatase-like hydrolase/transferase [Chryseolinea sp.]|nr:sulfatase-like hydrolase/transferase [Chryseolinea sp.]
MKRVFQPAKYIIALLSACALLVLAALNIRAHNGRATEIKPNILFILTDDQAYQTIHALGQREISTPNLDSLVGAGTSFTHTYNMGSWQGAVCSASRTMLLTGLSLWDARLHENSIDTLVSEGELWIQQLKRAGYETSMTGKWHGRSNVNLIFDHVLHASTNGPGQTPEGYNRPLSKDDTTWQPWDKKFGGFWKGGKHLSEVMADDVLELFAGSKDSDKPFFMYISFNAPHDPRQAPKAFIDQYPLDKISLPANYLDSYPYKEDIGAGMSSRDETLAPFPRTPFAVKKNIQEYYAIISHMDAQIGKMLQALIKSGKAQSTYVIFASDHGLAAGQHGLMGKQNMFDHSIRVPLIITGPGIPKNELRDKQVYLQDIMATVYDIAGLPKPEEVYYNSLLPVIHNKGSKAVYPEIYGGYMSLQRMVRTDRYKLIVYPKASQVLLFDLKNDPDEIHDVSKQSRYKGTLEDMKMRLIRQQQQLNDTLDLHTILGHNG